MELFGNSKSPSVLPGSPFIITRPMQENYASDYDFENAPRNT